MTRREDPAPSTFGYQYRTADDGSGQSHPTGERPVGSIIGSIPGGLGQFDGFPFTGAAVQQGFSGGGIYDPGQDAIVGMVQKGDRDTTKKIAFFLGTPALEKVIEGIPTPPPEPPIPPDQARQEITDVCESLRRTVHPSDGGFRGLGNVRGLDGRSGEWTTAMNQYILAAWDAPRYQATVRRATAWLLEPSRRRNGGWMDIGYDFPGGQNPACTEATTWAILALLEAAPALDAVLAGEASAAVGEAADWLLSNQQGDGGWGSCEIASTRTSRTYATAMSILAWLALRKSGGGRHPAWGDRPEASLLDGISFLHNTKQAEGWGFIPNVAAQLPSTAVALSALLMAQTDGYEAAVRPPLSECAREWLENLAGGRFDLSESTDVISFTDPTGNRPGDTQVQVPFNWHDWTLIAATLLGDLGTIRLAHEHMVRHVLPRRDQIYPWLSAMSAYGLMLYLRKYFT